ncbi:MAG: ribonucleoside triphosphate reductase [Candidatus Lernaella stagnicola]|nr:ribonucleoside triphosphate reductase [Candidatus Lernaella stagnicola]
MIRFIYKRTGERVAFDPQKIADAVWKAFVASGSKDQATVERIAAEVIDLLDVLFFKNNRIPTVENVQDLVENRLIHNNLHDIARRYIIYRNDHAQMRETQRMLANAVDMIDSYLDKIDWRINENSNMSFSLQGLNNHISSTISKSYWLNKIYGQELGDLHTSGDFHIHDLGQISAYCCGWDLKDLLFRGFGGVYGKVESAPPRHLRTALGQIVNFFYTLQGESAGAQAFANFDTYLSPYVRYDNLNYEQVHQCIQEFVFNLNVPTRVGFQTPFTNITMDLVCPSNMLDEAVAYGGELLNDTYGMFQHEMDMINQAFCEVMMAGDAKGRIFTFPIPTYNIHDNFDWDNKNLDILWQMTGRYGIPYFANFVNSDMKPEDVRSMCCRLRLDEKELRQRLSKRGGGLFGAHPQTGSIGVVTVNLPRVGYESGDESSWFGRIDYLMERARDSLETKRKVLERFTEQGLYPYTRHYLDGVKVGQHAYWYNHFSTIGLIGMNEALINFMGHSITHPAGKDLTIRTLEHMRDNLIRFQEETGNLYNLEATPAESTTYRLAQLDVAKYPDIFHQGVEDPYYTNSTSLPVNFTDDLFEALEHQDALQTLYTGGTVMHGFIGEKLDDTEAIKKLVRRIAENYKLPYYSITPTFTICPEHGYIPGEHFECPY